MPETPEQFYERTKDALKMPPVGEWETFPFEGDIRPRALRPPADDEKRGEGEGGIECFACSKTEDDLMWHDEQWQLSAIGPTSGSSAPSGQPETSAACTSDAGARAASICTCGSWDDRPGCGS